MNIYQEWQHQPKLPVGIPDFETIRRGNYVYVDKTQDIFRMATQGMYYFLSRPRRFGKSVLVTTLKCLFQGRQDLFDGLWISEHSDWEWHEHPVVLLDFSGITNTTPELLHEALATKLFTIADFYGIRLQSTLLASQFQELIVSLYRAKGEAVAILIDEYDKPIIDHLGRGAEELEIAKANRDVLKRFFGVLKSIDIAPILRFVFLTGITRFTKVSIFSELNNLDDLSMSDAYASILGYTQEELESYFKMRIQHFAQQQGKSYKKMVTALKEQYNGYRFSEKNLCVYNPFSILKALHEEKLQSYWFETGTPTFLINLLQQAKYTIPQIERIQVSQSIFTTFDIERLRPEALLFQTGYITIADVQNRLYTLTYPNLEVKLAFTESLLYALTSPTTEDISSPVLQLAGYLQNEEFDSFFETIQAIFASIPYDLESKRDKAYFHTIFYLIMTVSGADARSSVLTCRGRIDLALHFPNKVFLLEFKCNQSAEAAIRQIQEKGYAEPYRRDNLPLWLIGINFSTEQRNLAEWKVEPDMPSN